MSCSLVPFYLCMTSCLYELASRPSLAACRCLYSFCIYYKFILHNLSFSLMTSSLPHSHSHFTILPWFSIQFIILYPIIILHAITTFFMYHSSISYYCSILPRYYSWSSRVNLLMKMFNTFFIQLINENQYDTEVDKIWGRLIIYI